MFAKIIIQINPLYKSNHTFPKRIIQINASLQNESQKSMQVYKMNQKNARFNPNHTIRKRSFKNLKKGHPKKTQDPRNFHVYKRNNYTKKCVFTKITQINALYKSNQLSHLQKESQKLKVYLHNESHKSTLVYKIYSLYKPNQTFTKRSFKV